MSAYRTNGTEITSAYNTEGELLQQAYDIDGNPLFSVDPPVPPPKQSLVVMSYNVQWFTGINSQTAMQQEIINTYKPNIIGLQELSTDGVMPSVGENVLGNYTYKQLSYHKNYLGLASKIPFYGTVIADFATQDPYDASEFNETRAYMKTYFDFNGKKVCWINTHLALHDTYIYAQMNEIFTLAEQEENVIITGDFNTKFTDFNSAWYVNTYKLFVDAGYNLANNTPTAGITKTYSNSTSATTLADMLTNPDNIIVSENIDIDSVVFDTIKLHNLNGDVIDHIAVVANLLI